MSNVDHTAPVAPAAAQVAPAAQAPVKAPAKANGKAPAKAKAPAKGKAPAKATAAPTAPAKRSSRIAGLQGKVLAFIAGATDKNGRNVALVAKTVGCTERDVRLAIDRARAQGFGGELLRTVKNHFALTAKGKTILAKLGK